MPPKKRATAARAAQVAAVSPAWHGAARVDPLTAALLVLVVLVSGLAVDSAAEAAFDAPKRLFALAGIAAAAFVQFGASPSVPRGEAWQNQTRSQRTALVLVVAAIAGAVLAAIVSPRADVSIPACRVAVLFSLLLPVSASSALDEGRSRWIGGAVVGVAALNGLVALLESSGAVHLFSIASLPGRNPAIAFVGNEGLLAIDAAFAAVLAFAVLLGTRRAQGRALAGAALGLFAATLLVTGNLTAVTAAGAGSGVIALAASGAKRARLAAGGLAGAALLLAVATVSSGRVGAVVAGLRAGDWNPLLTFRLGAWGAAVEMVRERPVLGFGPGTFGAEFVPHRLAAEMRMRRRFTAPGVVQASFGEAHDEYLQGLAELGIPVTVAAVAAAATVMIGLWRVAARRDGEAAAVLAILVAGAVAAITWFPLQSPVLAIPLLIAAGRGWRLLGAERPA